MTEMPPEHMGDMPMMGDMPEMSLEDAAQSPVPVDVPVSEYEPAIDPELVPNKDIEKTVVENAVDLFDRYRNDQARLRYEDVLNAVYRAYNGYKPTNPGPYKVVYVIREGFREIETVKPQISKQFFGGSRLFKFNPCQEGGEERTIAADNIVHKQINRYGMRQELMKWNDAAIMYGTSYLTYGWQNFKRSQMKPSALYSKQGQTAWERPTTEIVHKCPYLECLTPWDVFVHPYVEDPRNSPAAFVLRAVSPADIKTRVREGFLDAKNAELALSEEGQASYVNEYLQKSRMNGLYDSALDRTAQGDLPQELMICWTSDGCEFVILNRQFLLRARQLPYGGIPPLIVQRNYPQVGEHYGKPEMECILEEQKLLNDFMSMFVAAGHYQLNPMHTVLRGAMKDWRAAVFQPGGAIACDKHDDFRPLATNNTVMDIANVGGFILNRMELASGVTREMAGAGSSSKTATGLVRLQDAAGARMEHKVRLFMPAFEQVYRTLYNLNAMYLEDSMAIRMEGEAGGEFTKHYGPEVFDGDIDVEIELSNVMETAPETQQKFLLLYEKLAQNPMIEERVLLEPLLRAFGFKRPKSVFKNSQTAQRDALRETQLILTSGTIPDPKPADDHATHMQIHTMQLNAPDFRALPLDWQQELARHMAEHEGYLQQMQAMQAQQQMPMQPQGPGSPLPEADLRTEANFNNGMTGAAQQGVMPQ
jgi:hypothetical protein